MATKNSETIPTFDKHNNLTGSQPMGGKGVPTSALDLTSSVVIAPGQATFDRMDGQIRQFQLVKAEKLANALLAYDAFLVAQTIYDQSVANTDYDFPAVLNHSKEAREKHALLGEATMALHAFRENAESLDNFIARMEEAKHSNASEADNQAHLEMLQKNFEEAVNAWVRNVESLNYKREWTGETYALREAVEVAREKLNDAKLQVLESSQADAEADFFDAQKEFDEIHQSIPDLLEEDYEEEIKRVTQVFWDALRANASATNELLDFQLLRWEQARKDIIQNDAEHDNIPSLVDLAAKLELNLGIYVQREEHEKGLEQKELMEKLSFQVTRFEDAYDHICGRSDESATSEEAENIGILLSQAKDNVARYNEHVKSDKILSGITSIEKVKIDSMNIEQMLRKWRFAPMGTFVNGEPGSEYFQTRMYQLRDANPEAWTRASKDIGW